MSYRLKEKPEDFFVEEMPIALSGSGSYRVYKLTKTSYDTEKAIKTISQATRMPRKFFAYAGTKDKHARTVQYFSVRSDKNIANIELENISLEYMGEHNEPLSLGSLEGNRFEIVVRNLDDIWTWDKDTALVPNYFDEQRFSVNNVRVGKMLLQKKYSEVCKELTASYWEITEHLDRQEHDFSGALQKVPKKILLLYVHAYQSYIYNLTLNKLLEKYENVRIPYSMGEFVFVKENVGNKDIPLIGFDPDPEGDKKVLDIIEKILEEKNVTHRDFVFHDLKYLSSEGTIRNMFMEIKDIEIGKSEEDELFSGKKKQTISFVLPKGSYATIFIKFLAAMQ